MLTTGPVAVAVTTGPSFNGFVCFFFATAEPGASTIAIAATNRTRTRDTAETQPMGAGLFGRRKEVDGVHRCALLHSQLGDLAVLVSGDLVLHLHRLDHHHDVAGRDLLALLDRDLEDVPLQRCDQVVAGGGRSAPSA